MNEVTKQKTMTITEFSNIMKVSHDTIRNKVRELFPELLKKGITTRLNETQITIIKMSLEKNPNLPTNEIVGMTDMEALILQKKLDIWKDNKIAELQKDNEIMKPKALYYDKLVENNHLTNIRDTAKQLNINERVFTKFLINSSLCYRDKNNKLKPMSEQNNGYFELKDFISETGFKSNQMFITVKGKEFIDKLYNDLNK